MFSNRFRILCLATLLLLTVAGTAHATLITITSGVFSPGASVADFTVATTQPLPYSEDGATFAAFSGFASGVLTFNNFLNLAGSGTLRVNFASPELRAGFSLRAPLGSSATVSVQAFSDLLGTVSLGSVVLGTLTPNQVGFLGFQASAPFLRADVAFAVTGTTASYQLDDFRFEPGAVPEPASLVLLGLTGSGWIAGRGMRRRRRATLRP
jgi:hypothetical protein